MFRSSQVRVEDRSESLRGGAVQGAAGLPGEGGEQPLRGMAARSGDAGAILLRRYRPSDLAVMTALDAECFSEEFLFGLPLMRVLAEKAHALTLIAETPEGVMAGFAMAHRMQESAPEAAYLVTLDVAPNERRRGVARQLLAGAQEAMLEAGALRMDLHVYTQNSAAISFYERQGYRRRARIANFYGDLHRDAFFYSRELQPTPIA